MAVMYAYFLDQGYQGPDPSLARLRPDDDAALSKARADAAAVPNGPLCNTQEKGSGTVSAPADYHKP